MNQLIERLAKLPRSQRVLLVFASYLAVVAVLYFALISTTLGAISNATADRETKTTKRNEVKKRAENRGAFEAELEDLAASLKQALKELPNDREIPGLLSEIDGIARKSGLDVRKFQPLPEVTDDYYAAVPVAITMDGGFHEVAIFFDRVSKMGRIVSVQDIRLGDPVESGTDVTLTITGKAVTYRFLTDKEQEEKQNRDKQDKKKKKGGGEE